MERRPTAVHPELNERLRLYRAGATDREISEREGIKPNTIAKWRRAAGLAVNLCARLSLMTEAQAAERMALYRSGWTDRRIADETGVTRETIKDWRKPRGLPANHNPDKRTVFVERDALYARGCSDAEIARASGIARAVAQRWRTCRGLPPNNSKSRSGSADKTLAIVMPDLKRRCLALLHRGVGPRLIARELGAPLKTLEHWRTVMLQAEPELRRPGTAPRKTLRHPNGRAYSKMRAERRQRAFLLYADGLDDHAIAADLGLYSQQVWEWRHAMFLPPIRRQGERAHKRTKAVRKAAGAAITPLSNTLYARIAQVVGRALPPDLRDDVISDMYIAVEEGALPIEAIEREARRFSNKVISTFASRYGPRSLDEEIGDPGDGFRLIDLIAGERSRNWLEEMGATVW